MRKWINLEIPLSFKADKNKKKTAAKTKTDGLQLINMEEVETEHGFLLDCHDEMEDWQRKV